MTRKIAVLACAMLLLLSMAVPALAAKQFYPSGVEEQAEDTEPAEREPREPSSISDDKTTCLLVIAVLFGSILVLGPLVHRGRTQGQGTSSDQ